MQKNVSARCDLMELDPGQSAREQKHKCMNMDIKLLPLLNHEISVVMKVGHKELVSVPWWPPGGLFCMQ